MKSTVTRADYDDFLVYLYFGSSPDYLSSCIQRAYRDLNRTISGFAEFPRREAVTNDTRDFLYRLFGDFGKNANNYQTQDDFDTWHEAACIDLCKIYAKHKFGAKPKLGAEPDLGIKPKPKPFSIGQAQKWINMTFKYIFVLGEERFDQMNPSPLDMVGFRQAYGFCHVPIDLIMIESFKIHKLPSLSTAWSSLESYDEYLEYQKKIRKISKLAPLDIEFRLWMGKTLE